MDPTIFHSILLPWFFFRHSSPGSFEISLRWKTDSPVGLSETPTHSTSPDLP